ncbi:hypothetical protein Trydic_g4359 [Trypoxylus dichotomus]
MKEYNIPAAILPLIEVGDTLAESQSRISKIQFLIYEITTYKTHGCGTTSHEKERWLLSRKVKRYFKIIIIIIIVVEAFGV